MNFIFRPPSMEDFIRLLQAWRFWVIGALIGGLAGAGFYAIFPPEYQAHATVAVSFNMEKAWPNKPDNELFYYLDRESRKVEEIAWSDLTLQTVTDQTGLDAAALRAGKLELSQPEDGGWHFYASDPSPIIAEKLASAWAEAFTSQVQQGLLVEVELDAARKALIQSPDDAKLKAEIGSLEAKSLAITPELQISISHSKNLSAERKTNLATYILAGSALFLALAGLGILFFGDRKSA